MRNKDTTQTRGLHIKGKSYEIISLEPRQFTLKLSNKEYKYFPTMEKAIDYLADYVALHGEELTTLQAYRDAYNDVHKEIQELLKG